MKKLILLLSVFFFFISELTLACSNDVFSELENIRKNPLVNDDVMLQKKYLEEFPNSFTSFKEIFDNSDVRYEVYSQHFDLFFKISKSYPEQAMKKMIGIAKSGSWDADAISFFQDALARYIVLNTCLFASQLNTEDANVKVGVIRFLADVENFSSYSEYPKIIENLKECEEEKLVKIFVDERARRKSLK